jgi:hypothetical protein
MSTEEAEAIGGGEYIPAGTRRKPINGDSAEIRFDLN